MRGELVGGWPWPRLPDPPQPREALIEGRVHYVCTVCETRMYPNRSALDAAGRCDECRP
jgi:hypothetical protein